MPDIEYVAISSIHPNPASRRMVILDLESDIGKQLLENVKQLGIVVPIIVTNDNEIIDGIVRWQIALALGWLVIPVVRIDSL